jgi:hypothetical protein
MITLFHAIQSLVPGAEVSVGTFDQKIEWHKPEVAPVTLEQIQAEQQRLQQVYDWNEYQRDRAREYPTIQEQLDALYHAGVFPPVMAARIRAVKEKYPRYSPEHIQTAEQIAPKLTVDEWLAEQTKVPAEQWLEQQQSTTHMTREQWLASQTQVRTVQNTQPVHNATRTMTTEEWLREQASLESVQKMTREQWLEQQKTVVSAPQMTREQWLAEQAKIK